MADHLVLTVAKKYLNKLKTSTDLGKGPNAWEDDGDKPDGTTDEILTVISKPLTVITCYGGTLAWLLDLSWSIFGKRLDTGQYGELWAKPHNGQNFQRLTDKSAPLQAMTYEYRPLAGAESPLGSPVRIFSLSRYLGVKQPAFTPKVPKEDRDQDHFGSRVRQRDERCVISRLSSNLVASHLVPNCLPTGAIKMILIRHSTDDAISLFNGYWGKKGNDANNDERIGVLALYPLDKMIDNFTLGFYCPDPTARPNEYEVHNFIDPQNPGEYNVLGITHVDYMNVPGAETPLDTLHRHKITFTSLLDGVKVLPRVAHGAIRWHYMQCVLKNLSNAGRDGYLVW